MGSSGTGIRHLVQNNVAWKNSAAGFYANHSSGGNTWYNNTSYSNGTQYNMLASSFAADGRTIATAVIILTGTKVHIMRNNIGYPNKNSNMTGVDTANNSWDLGITPAASDFASISDTGCTGPREADGSMPSACTFMHLTASSAMIDKGVDVGLPFVGKAPDLGAYEFGAVTTGAGGSSGSTGGSPGSGGSTGSGGSLGTGGSTRNDASPGTGGSTRSDGSVGNGGSTGNGGSISNGGSTGSGSGGSSSNGGASTAGTTGSTGGTSSAGGRVIAATGGATAAGGIIGTGGASQGSGGDIVAAAGGSASGGAAGTGGAPGTGATGGSSAGITSSGCGCAVGSRSPRSGMAAFLMVGALALLARRRRNRI
jgi:MYXO-CTERM domain-containing protein